jgi:putative ubiquitin-RnfH superfamily antitoxin RatB of RatAB toxin-antitoxin module
MGKDATVSIEVAYARPDVQRIVVVDVAPGTAAREVLRLSGLTGEFPEIDAEHCPLGIFGGVVEDEYGVKAGDRIEVYRPLERDPRDARRELASRGLTMRER